MDGQGRLAGAGLESRLGLARETVNADNRIHKREEKKIKIFPKSHNSPVSSVDHPLPLFLPLSLVVHGILCFINHSCCSLVVF